MNCTRFVLTSSLMGLDLYPDCFSSPNVFISGCCLLFSLLIVVCSFWPRLFGFGRFFLFVICCFFSVGFRYIGSAIHTFYFVGILFLLWFCIFIHTAVFARF